MTNSGRPNAPSQVTHKGRRRADTEDILAALEFADRASLKLPTLCAVVSSRVPSVSRNEVDVAALAINLEALRGQVENITAMNVMSEAQKNSVEMANSVLLNHQSFPPLSSMSSSLSSNNTGKKEPTSSLWADKAAAPASTAVPPNVTKKPIVKGSRSINHGSMSIKSVPRSDRVTFFIGRLDKATIETDLIEYLEEFGVSDENCKKLVAKDGWQFNTSAFRVSCPSSYKDICYDEDT